MKQQPTIAMDNLSNNSKIGTSSRPSSNTSRQFHLRPNPSYQSSNTPRVSRTNSMLANFSRRASAYFQSFRKSRNGSQGNYLVVLLLAVFSLIISAIAITLTVVLLLRSDVFGGGSSGSNSSNRFPSTNGRGSDGCGPNCEINNPFATIQSMEVVKQDFEKKMDALNAKLQDVQRNNILLQANLSQVRGKNKESSENYQQLAANTSQLGTDLNRLLQTPWPHNGYIYSVTRTKLSWQEAREECQFYDADLAVHGIKDYLTRNTIATAKDISEVWVGVSDQLQEGLWRWVDGSIGTTANIRWVASQPDNTNNNEHCGEMWPVDYEFRINDESCEKLNFALCEKRYNS